MTYVRKPRTAAKPGDTPVLVSFDLGNGYSKGRSAAGVFHFPSVIGEALDTLDGFSLNGGSRDFIIGFEGQKWAIGDSVLTQASGIYTIRDTSRIETSFYRTLFAAMLTCTVPCTPGTSVEVAPVLSLPPGMYYEKDRLKQALAGGYEVEVPDENGHLVPVFYHVPIPTMRVIPEGMGTICLLVLDAEGRGVEGETLHERTVGVVDVGTLTTDLVMLANLKIVRDSTRSVPRGLNEISKQILNFAGKHSLLLEEHQTDAILKRRAIPNGAQPLHIERELRAWSKNLADLIDGQIRTLWSGGKGVEQILLTGGGAPLVHEFLIDIYPDQVVLAGNDDIEPAMANAEGGYRFGLLRQQATGKSAS